MSPNARIEELFHAALELKPEDREAFLRRECNGDSGLLDRIRTLLEVDAEGTKGVLAKLSHADDDASLPPPARIGPYRILGVLGRGGMGCVYRAEQENPRREVALKVINPSAMTREVRRRFARESRSLAHLKHPAITQIFEAGTAPDDQGRERPFIAMELVHGPTITDHAATANLDLLQRLELVARVADAAQHAHQRGVIHRDLKPQNVLVEPLPADPIGQPKVLDFGIARLADPEDQDRTALTDSWRIVGTLAYMSPEQLDPGAGGIDTRADVYALGVLLFELLAGRTPLDVSGKTLAEAARVIRDVEPPRLGTLRRDCRGDVETIVRQALEKDRERRYSSAGDLAADLRRFATHRPISARPPTAIYQISRFVRRYRALTVAACIALLAIVLGSAASVVGYLRAVDAQHRADAQRALALEETRRLRNAVQFLHDGLVSSSYAYNLGPAVTLVDAFRSAGDSAGEYFKGDPLSEAKVRHTIALILTSRGEFSDALTYAASAAEAAAKLGPSADAESVAIQRSLILCQMRTGAAADAVSRAQALVERPANRSETVFASHVRALFAGALTERGDIAEALDQFRQSIATARAASPNRAVDWYVPLTRQGETLISLGRGREFDAALRDVVTRDAAGPALTRVRMQYLGRLAEMYAAEGREDDRIRVIKQAIEESSHQGDPSYVRAWECVGLAEALLDHEHPGAGPEILLAARRALQVADAATYETPKDVQEWDRRATAALIRAEARWGDPAKAAALLAAQQPPSSAETKYAPDILRLAHAELLLAQGKLKEAADLAAAEYQHRLAVRFLWDPQTHDAMRVTARALAAADGPAAAVAFLQAQAEAAASTRDAVTPAFAITTCEIAEALAGFGAAEQAQHILARQAEALWAKTPHLRPCAFRVLEQLITLTRRVQGAGPADAVRALWLQRLESSLGPNHPWKARLLAAGAEP